jgi:hypothetical protein
VGVPTNLDDVLLLLLGHVLEASLDLSREVNEAERVVMSIALAARSLAASLSSAPADSPAGKEPSTCVLPLCIYKYVKYRVVLDVSSLDGL